MEINELEPRHSTIEKLQVRYHPDWIYLCEIVIFTVGERTHDPCMDLETLQHCAPGSINLLSRKNDTDDTKFLDGFVIFAIIQFLGPKKVHQ